MSEQTTPKQWFALAPFLLMLLTGPALFIVTIWFGWSQKLVTDLPIIFWILYALFIISIFTLLVLPSDNPTQFNPPANSASSPISFINNLVQLLAIGWLGFLAITEQQWNATKLLGLTGLLFLIFFGGQKLLSYLRTRSESNPNPRPK